MDVEPMVRSCRHAQSAAAGAPVTEHPGKNGWEAARRRTSRGRSPLQTRSAVQNAGRKGQPPFLTGACPPGFGLGVEISCRVYRPTGPGKTPLLALLNQPHRKLETWRGPTCLPGRESDCPGGRAKGKSGVNQLRGGRYQRPPGESSEMAPARGQSGGRPEKPDPCAFLSCHPRISDGDDVEERFVRPLARRVSRQAMGSGW